MNSRLQEDFIGTIKEYQGIINSICLAYYSQPDDIKDARQDVILQLWRSFPTFRGEAKISTWIYRVTLNTILAKRRKEVRLSENESLSELHLNSISEPSSFIAEDFRELAYLINHLEDNDKAIILLLLEGYGNKEIAEILHYTPTNISTRLTRIRLKLRKQFPHEIK